MEKIKIIAAITGARGSMYANVLLNKLSKFKENTESLRVMMSENDKTFCKHEIRNNNYKNFKFNFNSKRDLTDPFAIGSARYSTMIICPCSKGTFGRIAAGTFDELITHAADVILKERRKLILVIRDIPHNLIHINNMKTVTEAGAII